MKRTAYFVDGSAVYGKITCEVTGVMADGTKVWTDWETGEQYMLRYLVTPDNHRIYYFEFL